MTVIPTKNKNDIIVIGAGIIGCAIANRLAQAGFNITIIEQAQACNEASHAAAGMLAPHAETAHSVPELLQKLMLASHKLYPEFLQNLTAETGIEIGYQNRGSLMVASGYRESRILAGLFERALAGKTNVEALTHEDIIRRQPGLAANIESAIFFSGDCQVNNHQLCKALVAAASGHGVEFRLDTPALAFTVQSGRVVSVKTPAGSLGADHFIVTAGAWSGNILQSIGLDLPVRPVRGQMVELAVHPQFLQSLIHASDCYIVPWPDGRTLVGATMEKVGFDKTVTAAGIRDLLAAATSVAPALDKSAVKRVWAGLRPDTRDNLPVLGHTHIPNLILATGHFRNGILLTPITAQLIYELLTGQPSSFSLSPFLFERFSPDITNHIS